MATENLSEPNQSAKSASFRLKAGLFPLTLVEILHRDRSSFERDLKEKVAQAPDFFKQTAVILSFDEQCTGNMSLSDIIEMSRNYGLIPVVMRGGSDALQQAAQACGLALMPEGKSRFTESEATPPKPAKPAADSVPVLTDAVVPPRNPNRIITRPIRSGQQVYCQGGDLIILSRVSAGAEVLADGNIHVYGSLLGRALAGVRGDTDARIFCHSLEAELISIAGDFQISEDLRGQWWKKAVQISLNGRAIKIEELS